MQFSEDPLGWLLEPASTDSFLSEYFNKRHFLARNEDRNRFSELLSFAQLDHIVGTYGLKHPEIRLARSEDKIPSEDYTFKDDRFIDPLRVARLFSEGATVVFRSLQNRHQPIQHLCNALSKQATIQTQANIYLTPPESQGFDIHWDTHDVFIIQIEGSKIWRMYDGGITLPIKSQRYNSDQYSPGEVIDEFVLNAGEVLYIPRGVMHAAASTSETSLHITLGFLGYSWAELLVHVLGEVTQSDAYWRENMPFGFENDADKGLARLQLAFKERLHRFIDEADITPAIQAHLWQIQAFSRPRESRFLANAIYARELLDTSSVELVSGLSISLVSSEDRIYLIGGSRELSFPSTAQKTLEAVISGEAFHVDQIEDDLDIESRKTVLTTLLREGIIRTNGQAAI